MRQFVEVKFGDGEERSYTYHNHGEQVKKGDRVEVPVRSHKATATVVSVSFRKPPYDTKAIIRVIPPPDESLIDDAGKPPQRGLL